MSLWQAQKDPPKCAKYCASLAKWHAVRSGAWPKTAPATACTPCHRLTQQRHFKYKQHAGSTHLMHRACHESGHEHQEEWNDFWKTCQKYRACQATQRAMPAAQKRNFTSFKTCGKDSFCRKRQHLVPSTKGRGGSERLPSSKQPWTHVRPKAPKDKWEPFATRVGKRMLGKGLRSTAVRGGTWSEHGLPNSAPWSCKGG